MAIERLDSAFADAQPSGEDLTGKEMLCATRNSDKELVVAGASEIVAGIIQEGKTAGLSSTISRGPICKVIAGEALAAGVKVESNSAGKAVAGSTTPFGTTRTSTGAADEIVEVAMD